MAVLQGNSFDSHKLHPVTHKPIGDIDYATDLDFDDIVLYSKTEDGLANFTSWMAENNFT